MVTREDSCFCVYRLQLLQLQSNTNGLLKPDGMSGSGGALEWDGVSVGSTPSGALREAANDSTVAGSRSGALLAVSSSTVFPFFSPPLCLAVCEKYVPCGLVGAVK